MPQSIYITRQTVLFPSSSR